MGSRKQPRPTTADAGQVSGKRILVTGASSGIGAATVELLAAEGAAVGVHYHRKKAEAQKLIEKIRTAGRGGGGVSADPVHRAARPPLVPVGPHALAGPGALRQQSRRVGGPGALLGVAETAAGP